MTGRLFAVFLAAVMMGGACSGDDDGTRATGDTLSSVTTSTTGAASTTGTTPAPSSTTSLGTRPAGDSSTTVTGGTTVTSAPPAGTPAAGVLVTGSEGADLARAPGGPPYGRLRAGVAVSYDAVEGSWARVLTPCENKAWLRVADGRTEPNAEVVLDAGHGGNEPGATGTGGLTEKELNLDVVGRAVTALRAAGVDAAVTRPSDYRVTIASRVAIAAALRPKAFVSVHHNAEPDGPREEPGTETFYQIRSPDSKRLAGLIYEEVVTALAAFPAQWVADTDAGAKYRTNDAGGDYYGILRRSGEVGLVASLAELAFVSNPSEEALLRRDDVRQAEAEALARALVRFLRSDDPGSGFTVPYPRVTPAGPGGGTAGCVDPA
ncbi:MAG: N-acetylmuramoyl-L-alanine amidase [Actinomycetota bacterium]|nr:N-acetylmuramoyl-L-alanine amidase [Actinomycetota bacterium]